MRDDRETVAAPVGYATPVEDKPIATKMPTLQGTLTMIAS
jgi:hypothetical protein